MEEQILQDVNAAFAAPIIDRPPPVRAAASGGPVNPYRSEPRVWIILQRGPHIPPTGQFFGYTGAVKQHDGSVHRMHREYVLVPGKAAWVPKGIVDILNNAVEDVPVKNEDDQVIGYEPRLRFSYQIANLPPPEGWVQEGVEPMQAAA